MSQPIAPSAQYTLQEYFTVESFSEAKHEYFDGSIIAMAGESIRHTRISANLVFATKAAFGDKPCDSFGSDLRVYVKAVRSIFYPDVTIICGEPQDDSALPSGEAVVNPTVIFEVLSPSTEKIDRTRKFSAYMQLESLREYVLVYVEQPRIESFLRQDDGTWSFSFAEGIDVAFKLRSLNVSLPMKQIFANVTFEPLPAPPALETK